MKSILFFCFVLALGCVSFARPLKVKPLPPSAFSKKTVLITVSNKEMYQMSCDGSLQAQLFQQQNGQWIEVKYDFDPSESPDAFYLDGKFSKRTMWSEGCDEFECKSVTGPISLRLTKFKKLGEKSNPLFKNNPHDESKTIWNYKTLLLSGHFKATYEYYTDSKCKNESAQKKQIEFEVL